MNPEVLKESVTTWQTIRLICEAYLEAERADSLWPIITNPYSQRGGASGYGANREGQEKNKGWGEKPQPEHNGQDSDASKPQSRESRESPKSEGREDTGKGRAIPDWQENWYEVASEFCRVDDEFPHRMDRNRVNRLKALGNAIVPAVALEIIKAIKEADSLL